MTTKEYLNIYRHLTDKLQNNNKSHHALPYPRPESYRRYASYRERTCCTDPSLNKNLREGENRDLGGGFALLATMEAVNAFNFEVSCHKTV